MDSPGPIAEVALAKEMSMPQMLFEREKRETLTPLSFLRHLVCQKLLEHLTRETNAYARHILLNKSALSDRDNRWSDVTTKEMGLSLFFTYTCPL